MFPVVLSFSFAALLEVTLLIRRICSAGCLHLAVCCLGRIEAALFMMRKTGSNWSAPNRQPPRTRAKQSKTVRVYLVTPRDTSFHFKHEMLPPPLLRGHKTTSLRIEGPGGAWLRILPKCCCASVTTDLSEKKEVRTHEKHLSRRKRTPLSLPSSGGKHRNEEPYSGCRQF